MNPEAVVLMVVTMVIIWGGLIAAVVAFRSANRRESQEATDQLQSRGEHTEAGHG